MQVTKLTYHDAKVTMVKVPLSKIERIDFRLCEQPRETLSHFYNRQIKKPNLLINAGFFSMADGSTVFQFVDESEVISENSAFHYGMGVVDAAQLMMGYLKDRSDWRDFISGYPCLIEDGKALKINYASEINYKARRSLLGYNISTLFLFAVEGKGLTFQECQDLMLQQGVEYGINLDGGGSTNLLVNGKRETSLLYNRAVDNVLAIYFKEVNPDAPVPDKTLYRVQVGAFSKRANADKMQESIRGLPDAIGAGYKNAYIRYINGLYKVQIGAFSIHANARRVVEDLSKFGYSAYITSV